MLLSTVLESNSWCHVLHKASLVSPESVLQVLRPSLHDHVSRCWVILVASYAYSLVYQGPYLNLSSTIKPAPLEMVY